MQINTPTAIFCKAQLRPEANHDLIVSPLSTATRLVRTRQRFSAVSPASSCPAVPTDRPSLSVALASAVKSAKSLALLFAVASFVSKSPPSLVSHSSPRASVSVAVSARKSAPSMPSPSSTCPRTSRTRSPTDMAPTASNSTGFLCRDLARFLVSWEPTVSAKVLR